MERFGRGVMDTLARNREQTRTLLSGYRERAAEEGVLQGISRLRRVGETERMTRRRSMRLLRAYAAHLFTNMAEGMRGCESAFLLLDPDGCVVQIRASGSFGDGLRSRGVDLGTVWRPDITGADAVSVGNKERCPLQSAGEENYLQILQDLALYYAPLQVMEEGLLRNMGGLAWICPLAQASGAFMLVALGMAGAINIRVSTAWNICDSCEEDSRGAVQLDINARNGNVSIIRHNQKFLEMPETPAMDRQWGTRETFAETGGEGRHNLPLLTKEEILEALEICNGNRSKAAVYLSVGRRTLYRYIDRLGIGEKQYHKST